MCDSLSLHINKTIDATKSIDNSCISRFFCVRVNQCVGAVPNWREHVVPVGVFYGELVTSSLVVRLWVPRRASSHRAEESVLRPRERCSGLNANQIVPVRTRGTLFCIPVGASNDGWMVH